MASEIRGKVPPIYFLTPEHKTPTLLYETRPNHLNNDNLQAFRDRTLTLAHPDEPHMKKYGRFGETPVLRNRP